MPTRNDKPRVSLVTGAGSGIGRAVAHQMAGQGSVGVLDSRGEAVESTCAEIAAAGGCAIPLQADVTAPEQMDEAVHRLTGERGPLDVVVACAGIDTSGSILDATEDDWDRVMGVNAKGTFITAKATIPKLLESTAGRFVAISSDAGVVGAQGFAIYCASKHAVVGLVRALAIDYGHSNLRCNVVCPAFVETPMSRAYFEQAAESEALYWKGVVPLGRFAAPLEIAQVVDYLASEDAAYVNGSIYLVDGGATAALNHTAIGA